MVYKYAKIQEMYLSNKWWQTVRVSADVNVVKGLF